MKSIFYAAAFVAATAGAAQVIAAASPAITGAINARKTNYKEIGGAFKAVRDEIGSGSPDFRAIRPMTRDIVARSASQLRLFPRGSGPESGLRTRAKPAIWANLPAFARAQNEMVAAARALDAAAQAGNAAQLQAAHTALGRTCRTCHDQYREEE